MLPLERPIAKVTRRLLGVPPRGMPLDTLKARAFLAAVIARKAARAAWTRERPLAAAARVAAGEAVFLELALRNFAAGSMIRSRHGFFPHIFTPDYHGPHFEEALRRLAFSGRGPNILYFSLTGACPCHCEYCFASAGGAEPPDFGDEPAFEVARRVAALRVPLVNLSGGEPLSRYPRTLETVRLLSRGSEVRMFTTGIGLTHERLAELREAGLRGVFVSLDTHDAEVFDDARRRPGAFRAAVDALRLCAEAGMLTFVNAVVDRKRFAHRSDVSRFLRFIADIDPRIVVNFLPQLATGRGADADSFRTPEECEEVADRIFSTASAVGRPISMLFGRIDRFIGCPGAGGKLMNIDTLGNVTVCISRAGLGNILEEPFEVIYDRFKEHCQRLKTSFFCCEVSETTGGRLLRPDETARALDRFYDDSRDSEWQRILDRYGWLLTRLLPE